MQLAVSDNSFKCFTINVYIHGGYPRCWFTIFSGTRNLLSQEYFICNSSTDSHFFIVLGLNDTSTLVGHFVSSPREREKKDRRDSRGDEREGQRGEENE